MKAFATPHEPRRRWALRLGTSMGALACACLTVAACRVQSNVAAPHQTPPSAKPPPTSASDGASAALARHRKQLGSPLEEDLPLALLPVAGGENVLAVTDDVRTTAWATLIDRNGGFTKLRPFDGAHVVTAFASKEGRTTFITSNGDALCTTSFAPNADLAEASVCHELRPETVAFVGDKLGLLWLDLTESASAKTASKKGENAQSKPVSKSPKPGAQKPTSKKVSPNKPGGTSTAGVSGNKSSAASKKTSKKKKPPREAAKVPVPKAKVRVGVSWLGADGAPAVGRVASGLTFERPLAGMMLADAVPREGGLDVLFFESVSKPKKPSKTAYGSARLGFARLGSDGLLVPGSRGALAEGDLEYGYISGQNAPRLVASESATALVTFAGRAGTCRAERLFPTVGPSVFSKAGCLTDPVGTVLGDGAGALPLPFAEHLLSADPRRFPGQTKADAPLVVWTSEQGFFVGANGFGKVRRPSSAKAISAANRDAASEVANGVTALPTDAPTLAKHPFVAKRSHIVWSAFAPDGEGIANVDGQLFRLDKAGVVSPVALFGDEKGAMGASIASVTADLLAFAGLFKTPSPIATVPRAANAPGRQRAARIGDTWWFAFGSVIRLTPTPLRPDALVSKAHVDATALVGGRERGIFLEVASGVFTATWVTPGGALTKVPSVPSPIRPGFAAVSRSAGGAILAGVSAADPTRVVAFIVDDAGNMSAPRSTSLRALPGTFLLRMTALPNGGALLFDADRARVVWLDDSAQERGAAPLPSERNGARCVSGRGAETQVPSVEPGKFVRVADLAAPGTCLSGELQWTAAASLRWFGSTVRGLDSIAEVGVIDDVFSETPAALGTSPAPSAPAPSTASSVRAVASTVPPLIVAPSAPALSPASSASSAASAATAAPAATAAQPPIAACPADMVNIAGRYCIDRFESTLFDAKTSRELSPDYPSTPNLLEIVLGDFATDHAHWGDVHARAFPLPPIPVWQRGTKTEPVALPYFGGRPNGYVTGLVAEAACAAAGKRLCTLDEHQTACRGETETTFPYGPDYQDGACNVFREDHPAAILHHNASLGHLDPRLNRVRSKGRPLFETAGARPACRSVWGADAAYDLVGNLDEWVDEGSGAFAGGFYSRSTRAGCDAVITAHPKVYADYSTGVRCCKGAETQPTAPSAP